MSESNQPKIFALVLAAGVGSRMAANFPKQYMIIEGKTMLEHSVNALLKEPRIVRLVVVLSPTDMIGMGLTFEDPRVEVARIGGNTRAMSVKNGLAYLAGEENVWVLVHDAARPCVSSTDIKSLIDTCFEKQQGGLLASPLSDTLKIASSEQTVDKTIPRDHMWAAQTPQFFPLDKLYDALSHPSEQITDESSAMESVGEHPLLIKGSPFNIKVTRPEDLDFARTIIHFRNAQ